MGTPTHERYRGYPGPGRGCRLPEPGPLPNRLQLTDDGQLRHLLTIEGLNRDLLNEILDTAESSRT